MRRTTTIFMLIAMVVLTIWDVIVATNNVKGDTISEITRDAATTVYLIPHVCGIVMGHLFWNSDTRPNRFRLLFWPILAVAAADAFQLLRFTGGNITIFTLSIAIGAYFWPQKHGITSPDDTLPASPDADGGTVHPVPGDSTGNGGPN